MPALIPKDFVVIGGGLVGLASAYRLLQTGWVESVTLLEKDARVASQQSTHNSGVLHAGLYYKPGSEKARLSVRGLKQMTAFCSDHRLPYEICGKIVIAANNEEAARLGELWTRGEQNGLRGLRKLCPEEIKEIEPNAVGVAAIHVPEEGLVDYRAVADKLAAEITRLGGRVLVNARVTGLARRQRRWRIDTAAGDFTADYVINCGGLHSDRLVKLSGQRPIAKIVPFRGEYFQLKAARAKLVRHLIYPVPDPKFPFLGVHFTRMIHGGVEAGPNAVLALAREGYHKSAVNVRDLVETLGFRGLWRFLGRHPAISAYELYRSFSRRAFCRSLQRLVPAVTTDDLEPGPTGVRAQAMWPDGRLVDDFHFVRGDGILHVVNAPSPAATASLAIGERIVQEVARDTSPRRAPEPEPALPPLASHRGGGLS